LKRESLSPCQARLLLSSAKPPIDVVWAGDDDDDNDGGVEVDGDIAVEVKSA